MAKKVFYTLSRTIDDDGIKKENFYKQEGFNVPNEFNLDLAVYKAADKITNPSCDYHKIWFVVDCDCGLAVGEGDTKKDAIDDAFSRLSKVNMLIYKDGVKKANEMYGIPPLKRITYL